MKINIHRMTCRKADLFMLGFILLVSVLPADQVCAQYLGVTLRFSIQRPVDRSGNLPDQSRHIAL